MMAGALVARSLGSEQHGNWVLLTIAVVLRANYGLTRQRRDDRVIGTLVGCVAAAGFVAYLPLGALVAVQGSSIALLQSFVRLDYRIASIGASVSALVSLHLAQPDLPAPILARLADTLIGAAIAHAFSFVWPRWEFLEAPRIASRLQDRLSVFAGVALRPEASNLEYRMARKNMIEALAALSEFGWAHEHRADRDAQGPRRDGGAAHGGAWACRPIVGGAPRRPSGTPGDGRRDAGLASGPARAEGGRIGAYRSSSARPARRSGARRRRRRTAL